LALTITFLKRSLISMSKLSNQNPETARNIQKVLELAIADKGLEFVGASLGYGKSQVSKFVNANNPDDCKVNIVSLSELLSGLGLNITPADHIPVKKSTVAWAWMSVREANGGVGPQLKMLRDYYQDYFGTSIEGLSND
jgi:hypothetical protein